MKIYKYNLPEFGKSSIMMPRDAIVQDTGVQNGFPVVWMRFEEENENYLIAREFLSAWTGHSISIGKSFCHGSLTLGNGTVIHIFEILPI